MIKQEVLQRCTHHIGVSADKKEKYWRKMSSSNNSKTTTCMYSVTFNSKMFLAYSPRMAIKRNQDLAWQLKKLTMREEFCFELDWSHTVKETHHTATKDEKLTTLINSINTSIVWWLSRCCIPLELTHYGWFELFATAWCYSHSRQCPLTHTLTSQTLNSKEGLKGWICASSRNRLLGNKGKYTQFCTQRYRNLKIQIHEVRSLRTCVLAFAHYPKHLWRNLTDSIPAWKMSETQTWNSRTWICTTAEKFPP